MTSEKEHAFSLVLAKHGVRIRGRCALLKLHVDSIESFAKVTRLDLLSCPNCGEVSLREIEAAARALGVTLKDWPDDATPSLADVLLRESVLLAERDADRARIDVLAPLAAAARAYAEAEAVSGDTWSYTTDGSPTVETQAKLSAPRPALGRARLRGGGGEDDMSWNPKEIATMRAAVLALTAEERTALTWEDARRLVPTDTICLAIWGGVSRRRTKSPFEALCAVHCIDEAALIAK